MLEVEFSEHKRKRRIDYLETDLILGTVPGSRRAYDTPLKVVPISNARTNFLEVPV